jgi:hypothetical protein
LTTIGDKADYVRAKIKEGRPGNHGCHWPGCEAKVPAAQWGCRAHWYRLPPTLRQKIWATFRPGQEETKTPSREYVAVANEVQTWIRENAS